ncbi:glycoside hydrolase family 140 protein [Nibrella saemangeumensis]|uniref:Glycoside hydrolase family 140 protein n=1 Tax=Nibrella saemangeumensis TaxID=1084526 RepID=A0ABP8MUD3_9BACT
MWLLLAGTTLQAQVSLPRLQVSLNGRYLAQESGKPFFYLGDTAWELFNKLDSAEAIRYLNDRAAKRFTVIQSHFLTLKSDWRNTYGELPFLNGDFDTPNERYWRHVDFIVKEATNRGLYLAVVPAWCLFFIEKPDAPLYADSARAYRYGRFLGERYKDFPNFIWVLGGDKRPTRHAIYRNLASGLTDAYAHGDPYRILLTYHPPGGTHRPPATSTGEFYHEEPWLDFNMIQSGHRVTNRNYERITEDYARFPIKPTLDAEPCYEQHPQLHKYENGAFSAWHVRRRGWWSVLAGGCGFTYGGNGIWQMEKPGQIFLPTHFKDYWYDALQYEGAGQMQHLRSLVERLGLDRMVPDSTLLRSPGGTVDDRVQAARDEAYEFVVAYITDGRPIALDLTRLSSKRPGGYWFNPRTGQETPIKRIEPGVQTVFNPPTAGAENDWVLVVGKVKRPK